MVLVVVGWGQRPPKLIRESAWVGQAALVEKRSKRLPGSDRVRWMRKGDRWPTPIEWNGWDRTRGSGGPDQWGRECTGQEAPSLVMVMSCGVSIDPQVRDWGSQSQGVLVCWPYPRSRWGRKRPRWQ